MWEFWEISINILAEIVTGERDRFEKFQVKNQGPMMTCGKVEFEGNFGWVQ